ncbi:MAG TPA: putative quinol monooxygenase [Lacipirellulaceae bacterium]|nr:putative quinol monooxygenase [Lacipirellulaceae bacterium]HMP06977.1 putative quinol monooxygenase [Lacipirellulaceae bacterium]
MIHVIAEIEAHQGARDALLQEFHRIVPIVRDEDGCIEYGPAVDLPFDIGPDARPNMVTVVEKWTTVEALQAHLAAPHMEEYRKRAGHLIAGLSIRVLQPA